MSGRPISNRRAVSFQAPDQSSLNRLPKRFRSLTRTAHGFRGRQRSVSDATVDSKTQYFKLHIGIQVLSTELQRVVHGIQLWATGAAHRDQALAHYFVGCIVSDFCALRESRAEEIKFAQALCLANNSLA